MCHLVLAFFGLSSDYRNYVLDEVYYMVKHVNFDRESVMKMPIFERRYHLQKYVNELESQKQSMESAKKK